jgi:hypothetical protein
MVSYVARVHALSLLCGGTPSSPLRIGFPVIAFERQPGRRNVHDHVPQTLDARPRHYPLPLRPRCKELTV